MRPHLRFDIVAAAAPIGRELQDPALEADAVEARGCAILLDTEQDVMLIGGLVQGNHPIPVLSRHSFVAARKHRVAKIMGARIIGSNYSGTPCNNMTIQDVTPAL